MPPLTNEQQLRKRHVKQYTELYNRYISPILEGKPIMLKENDIDKYVSDEKNYPGFNEAQELNAILKSKAEAADKLPDGRGGFKGDLLQFEMLPYLPNMNPQEALEIIKHNDEILNDYAPGEVGDINELEQEQKYWNQLLNIGFTSLAFKSDDEFNDKIKKINNNNLLYHFKTISDRLKVLGQAPDAEEYKLIEQKSTLIENYFKFENSRMQVLSNDLMHSIPGVDWLKMPVDQLIAIRSELAYKAALNPEDTELADFRKEFEEFSGSLMTYKTVETVGPRQAQVLAYFNNNIMFTNHGFNAHCYDMDGNPIDDVTTAVGEYIKSGKAFIAVYDIDFIKEGVEDKFSVFTIDKNGDVAIEKADLVKYPKIFQNRFEQYQQKIVEKTNADNEAEMQRRGAELRKAAEEKEKAEQHKIEADKLKAQQIKKEEPQKEESKQEEPILNPDEGELLKSRPQYKDPFVVPEMKSEQLTKKLIKDRYNAAVNINKELNSYYPKMNKFLFDKDEFTQLAADQNRYDAHKYAKQFIEFVDSIKTSNLPSLQGSSVNKISNLVPNELKEKPAKDILKYFVSRAYNADLRWLMDVSDDVNLAKNMAKHYSDLKIAAMGREIIEFAQSENIKLDIPDEVKNTIIVNSELMRNKFSIATDRINLLADPNYNLMPDFEAHNIESSMAESYAKEITQKNLSNPKNKNHQLSPLVATFYTYAKSYDSKNAFQKEIEISRQLYDEAALTDLDIDNAECFVLAGSKKKIKKKSYTEVIDALGEGKTVAIFPKQSHLGLVLSLDEDGNLEVEQRQRYAIIGDVNPTEAEKKYEAAHMEKREKQAKIQDAINDSRDALARLAKQMSKYALREVPKEQWPNDLKEYGIIPEEYCTKISKTRWDKIQKNIDEFELTDDEISQQIDAKKQLRLLQKHKTLEMDNEQQLDKLPWMMYQLFKTPLPETTENKAENEKITEYNSGLFTALNFREDVYEKYNGLRKKQSTKEEKKEFRDYHDELLAKPLEYVNNPKRATEEVEKLFKKVITECKPEWFDALTDEKMIEDWSKKAPYFELLTSDNFIKSVKSWGVKLSAHDRDIFETEKALFTDKIRAMDFKMESLKTPYYQELDKLNLSKDEMKLGRDITSSKIHDGLGSYQFLKADVERTKLKSENCDRLIELLKSMDCYGTDLNNLSNGKVFCNKKGVPISFSDAIARIRQDAGKPKKDRVLDNVVYVMDHTQKTCKRVCLDDNGAYHCDDYDYKEMLEASKLAESKSVAVDNTKALKEDKLGVKYAISALEKYKKKFDNTDFPLFVSNKEKITNVRKQLDVVLKLYKDLKPVPLDSDIKKLNNALKDFNTKLDDYIRYKEDKEGMTPENGYPEGYYSNTIKAQKDLSWRAFDRLDTAHQLKSLTEMSLLPNVKSDVIEFALYNQQQRMLNYEQDDAIIDPNNPDVLAVYNKTLANLRTRKDNRIKALTEAINNSQYFLDNFTLSQDAIEEGYVDVKAYNNADDLLVDAYDFETVKGKPVYSADAQKKMYSDLAKCICNWTLHRYKNSAEYKELENLDRSGFDMWAPNLDKDAEKLADSQEIRKLLPPEKLSPMAIINLVSDMDKMLGKFKEACGKDSAILLREYQVERQAVVRQGNIEIDVNRMPTDPKFDKQAMQDIIDGKVHEIVDVDAFLNDDEPEEISEQPFVRH